MSTAAAHPTLAARVVHVTWKQLLTLFGLVPLGVYVFVHLWTNLYSLAGPTAFNQAVRESRSSPAFLFLEVFGLGVPLLAHTVIGLGEIVRSRPNNVRYGFFDNARYLLQRISAIGLLLFIGAHVWRARLAPAMAGRTEDYAGMHEALSEPITLAVYILGMLGVAYHLANGLQTAATRTGLVVSDAGRRRMTWVSSGVLVLLLAMSGLAIAGFFIEPVVQAGA